VSGCSIDSQACPQFNTLRERWKKNGYPSIDSDLEEAFKEIRKNIQAKHCRSVPRFKSVLGDLQLFKYRQKNDAAREGARGGWRFYALFNKATGVLYPIVVYPKKALPDADDDTVKEGIEQVIKMLSESERLF
jgi:hypothetical protein